MARIQIILCISSRNQESRGIATEDTFVNAFRALWETDEGSTGWLANTRANPIHRLRQGVAARNASS